MSQTYNPCDECDYSFSKQNQDSGMCKICEYKKLQETSFDAIEMCKIHIALDKLKEYKRLEEQGLLLRLPCKIGDTVYVLEVDEENFERFHYEVKVEKYRFETNMIELVGKCVFLTKEEAEQALKADGRVRG